VLFVNANWPSRCPLSQPEQAIHWRPSSDAAGAARSWSTAARSKAPWPSSPPEAPWLWGGVAWALRLGVGGLPPLPGWLGSPRARAPLRSPDDPGRSRPALTTWRRRPCWYATRPAQWTSAAGSRGWPPPPGWRSRPLCWR